MRKSPQQIAREVEYKSLQESLRHGYLSTGLVFAFMGLISMISLLVDHSSSTLDIYKI